MKQRAEFGVALLLLLVGGGGVVLIAGRHWQTIGTHHVGVDGRSLDAAPTALGLVALAGVVAVIVTRGPARRALGVLLAVAGVIAIWRSLDAAGPVSSARAEDILRAKQQVTIIGGAPPSVATHPVWAVLSVVASALVVLAGGLVAVRGGRWAGMSARYQRPAAPHADDAEPTSEVDAERVRTRAHAALWSELERGLDPTDDPTDDSTADRTDEPAADTTGDSTERDPRDVD